MRVSSATTTDLLESDEGVLLVPDTNSLVDQPEPAQYRPIAERDDFAFVLLPTVLGELDELKIAHENPRRARLPSAPRIRGLRRSREVTLLFRWTHEWRDRCIRR